MKQENGLYLIKKGIIIKINMSSYYFLCSRCKKGKSDYISLPCSKCVKSKEYQQELMEFNKKYKSGRQLVGRYKDPVAFGVDKKSGRFVAMDKHGKYFDPRETRYAKHPDDPNGWKATGKKVKKYDSRGKRIE